MSANTKRLGDAIHTRRQYLALNQQEVAAAGGPSDTTLSKLENNLIDVVSNATLRKLDRGLEWVRGSARRVLYEDGDPIPIEESDMVFVAPKTETRDIPAWNTRTPEGMTEEQHRAIVRETEEYYQFRIQQAAKER